MKIKLLHVFLSIVLIVASGILASCAPLENLLKTIEEREEEPAKDKEQPSDDEEQEGEETEEDEQEQEGEEEQGTDTRAEEEQQEQKPGSE